MKKCPFCAEEILDDAIVCRYCGRDLDTTPKAQAPENTLLVTHPSLWTVFKEILLIVIVIVAAVGLYRYTHYSLYALILAPAIALYTWLVRLSHTYTITSRRVVCREGLIANNTNEIDIKDVRSVTVQQNALNRIINIGHVLIGTAGTDGVEIALMGVSAPHKIKTLILDQKK